MRHVRQIASKAASVPPESETSTSGMGDGEQATGEQGPDRAGSRPVPGDLTPRWDTEGRPLGSSPTAASTS